MKMQICVRCKKRPASVFITRLDGGNSINEGLCFQCAAELGIKPPPVVDMLKKMGGASAMMSMMPGMGKLKIKEGDIDENEIYRTKAIIQSMTEKERRNPQILNYSRKMRIAKGSGTSLQQINTLLKQYEQIKTLIKQMKSSKGKRLPFKF